MIPVEQIDGPVLLTCGGLDLEWPSCSYADDVTRRLTAHHFRHPVTVLRYPNGGHLSGDIPPGALYTSQTLAGLGGTVAAAQQSSAEAEAKSSPSWPTDDHQRRAERHGPPPGVIHASMDWD